MGKIVSGITGLAGGLLGQQSGSSQQSDMSRYAGQADPFGSSRGQYVTQLNDLMKNPSSVSNLPGYQFQYQQGLDALTRTSAATGYTGSGNEAIALEKYGQNYAQGAFTNYEQMLAQLAGATQSPASGAGTAANITSAGYSANNSGVGGLLGAIGGLFGGSGGGGGMFGGGGLGSIMSLFSGGGGATSGAGSALAGGSDLGQISSDVMVA